MEDGRVEKGSGAERMGEDGIKAAVGAGEVSGAESARATAGLHRNIPETIAVDNIPPMNASMGGLVGRSSLIHCASTSTSMSCSVQKIFLRTEEGEEENLSSCSFHIS